MNPLLKKLLEATHLTGSGKLAEATAAIQHALSGDSAPFSQSVPAASAARRTTTGDGSVVPDGLVRGARASVTEAPFREPIAEPASAPVGEPAPAATRFEASSYTSASGTRRFKLFEPGAAASGPRPLVVMLHGCTQDPDDFAAGTRMNALAEAQGVFVLYPEQAARSNVNRCWNWFVPGDQKRGIGEPALIAGMTRHVMEAHRIDADRVYVAGLSAGGAMAAILAREYPDLYAAAGVHSGLPAGAAHDVASAFGAMKGASFGMPAGFAPMPAAPVSNHGPSTPVIVFHGSADTTVAPGNGDAVISAALASAPGAQRFDRDGGSVAGRRYRQSVWSVPGAAEGAPSVAEQWTVSGAPHAWSGGASAGSYTDAAGPDASVEMLRFFLAHPRTPRH